MSVHFHIRPVGDLEQGFELTCDRFFSHRVHHQRLFEAVIHAAQVAGGLAGEICVHDCEGDLVETLPLGAFASMPSPLSVSSSQSNPRHEERKAA